VSTPAKLQGYDNGFYIGGCLFDAVTPQMRIYREEIFGQVLIVRAKTYAVYFALSRDRLFLASRHLDADAHAGFG
jgi:malonate-semialdehyde dehydrogenase (acetylating)/methylmalonate-semialdehyde dehydrogenase